MLYEQVIKYFEYKESGVRIRGVGYAKLERWDQSCSLYIRITGLKDRLNGAYPVYVMTDHVEKQIGEIGLEGGNGYLEQVDVAEPEMERIRIPMGPDRELTCIFRVGEESGLRRKEAENREKRKQEELQGEMPGEMQGQEGLMEESSTENQRMEKNRVEQPFETQRRERSRVEQLTETQGKESSVEGPLTKTQEQERSWEEPQVTIQQQAAPVTESQVKTGYKRPAATADMTAVEKSPGEKRNEETCEKEKFQPLQADKWEQLRKIYPLMAPFHDEREYLQISPGDFVILKDRSYRMANNSFLLHGYFNYRHLILHRVRSRGENLYYIGVPGNFYDKEKEVALLFGFESFECAKEPAQNGDFGYYMMRVEL